jgi:hypothetical protein
VISPAEDFDVEEWLQSTPYSDRQKEGFRRLDEENLHPLNCPAQKGRRVKHFIKREGYPIVGKGPRGIYERHNKSKLFLGPIIKKIEKLVYPNLDHFIKHVPVKERPAFLKEELDVAGNKYWVTDYTAYESSFIRQVKDVCEFELYRHCLKHHPERLRILLDILGSKNIITNKHWRFELDSCRMSGEMDTSLANGYANVCFLLFLLDRQGIKLKLRSEGDDSLSSAPLHAELHAEMLADLGIVLTMETKECFSEGSFCGLMACPDALDNMTDPVKAIIKFGWTYSKLHAGKAKMEELLRAKALSLGFEYPRCPILWALSKQILKLLGEGKAVFTDRWKLQQSNLETMSPSLIKAGIAEPKMSSRVACAKLFGISIDTQRAVEQQIFSMTKIRPFNEGPLHDLILSRSTPDQQRYYRNYCVTAKAGSRWVPILD